MSMRVVVLLVEILVDEVEKLMEVECEVLVLVLDVE